MNRLRLLYHSLGRYGPAGLGTLVLCAVFYLAAVMPAETDLAARRTADLQPSLRSPDVLRGADPRNASPRALRDRFPATDQMPVELEKLWASASAHQIELPRGEYRLESAEAGLVRYRVTLPVRATYARLRAFINFVLTEIPNASIDGLRFTRKGIDETVLDAQIELTLYYRSAGTTAARL